MSTFIYLLAATQKDTNIPITEGWLNNITIQKSTQIDINLVVKMLIVITNNNYNNTIDQLSDTYKKNAAYKTKLHKINEDKL